MLTSTGPVGEIKMLHGEVVKDSQQYFGEGSFGDVFLGTWTDRAGVPVRVAIKIFRGAHLDDKKENIEKRLKRESIVWTKLKHRNVLPFLGLCSDFGSLALISPYCKFGHVMKYLREHPTADKLAIVKGVAQGLLYLHTQDVIHGDIKGTNILIDGQGVPQICDFGRSKIVDHAGFTTPLPGTLRYLAPELAARGNTVPKLSMPTDVYSFAMVTFEIFTGKIPFSGLTDLQVILVVADGNRPNRERYNSPTSDDRVWRLLEKWWAQDPKTRSNMQDVVSALNRI